MGARFVLSWSRCKGVESVNVMYVLLRQIRQTLHSKTVLALKQAFTYSPVNIKEISRSNSGETQNNGQLNITKICKSPYKAPSSDRPCVPIHLNIATCRLHRKTTGYHAFGSAIPTRIPSLKKRQFSQAKTTSLELQNTENVPFILTD